MQNFCGGGGGVSWKFGNNNYRDTSNCVVRNQFGVSRRPIENNMGDSDCEERCITPSMMKAGFGEGNGHIGVNGGGNDKELPKVPVKKKKRTTFTWVPAKQEDADAKNAGDATNTDIVCDKKDSDLNPDVQDDISTSSNHSNKEASISSNPSNSDNSQSWQSQNGACNMDLNQVEAIVPCDEDQWVPYKPAADGNNEGTLDANANPDITNPPPQKWQSFDSNCSQTEDSLNETVDIPHSSEDDGAIRTDRGEIEHAESIDEVVAIHEGDEGDVSTCQDVVENIKEDDQAPPRPSPPQTQPPVVHHSNAQHDEPRQRQNEIHNTQPIHQQQQQQAPIQQPTPVPTRQQVPEPPAAPPAPPPAPPTPQAPPAPPPQAPPQAPSPQNSAPPAPPGAPPAPPGAPPAPPGPPPPPGGGGPPAPPPPPPPPGPSSGGGPGGGGGNDLAAQLAAAKLKKAAPKEEEAKPRKGGPGGFNMMEDLQRKLKERQKKSDGGSEPAKTPPATASKQNKSPPQQPKSDHNRTQKPWEKNNANRFNSSNGPTPSSPKIGRRGSVTNGNGGSDHIDFDKMKQEIMTEMRKEMKVMKDEIIEAIKMELNRR